MYILVQIVFLFESASKCSMYHPRTRGLAAQFNGEIEFVDILKILAHLFDILNMLDNVRLCGYRAVISCAPLHHPDNS